MNSAGAGSVTPVKCGGTHLLSGRYCWWISESHWQAVSSSPWKEIWTLHVVHRHKYSELETV